MNRDSTEQMHEGDPYVIVSTDSHVSPSLDAMQEYCPRQYLEDYGRFAREREGRAAADPFYTTLDTGPREAWTRGVTDEGVNDPEKRLRNMDKDGVSAEVLFHGNPEIYGGGVIPFLGKEIESGISGVNRDLQAVGKRIFNRWLSDFCSTDRLRLLGIPELPYWEMSEAVREVEWAAAQGFRGINFPAPRYGLPTYDDPAWEPFWNAIEETGLVLNCHSGVRIHAYSSAGVLGRALYFAETQRASHAPLAMLIYTGVFTRHPELRIIFNEQRINWVYQELQDLDSIYVNPQHAEIRKLIPESPSEAWRHHCFAGGSFMAHFELEHRHDIGLDHITWGRDYPHLEGTWPHTREALRATFSDLPPSEVRTILGDSAIACYGLDRDALAKVASAIGPQPSEIAQPLEATPDDAWSWAFRDRQDAKGGARTGTY